ncbi:MAG: maleylpyruvate isomerase N-terminal domain-containing protein [Flavobacterium sp.]
MKNSKIIPIQTSHLFSVLDELLIELLKSLTEEEWNVQTIAKKWTVKDIASHLLDGNLRGLSISRDHFFLEKNLKILIPTEIWLIF